MLRFGIAHLLLLKNNFIHYFIYWLSQLQKELPEEVSRLLTIANRTLPRAVLLLYFVRFEITF